MPQEIDISDMVGAAMDLLVERDTDRKWKILEPLFDSFMRELATGGDGSAANAYWEKYYELGGTCPRIMG